jgi:phytoene dehydrogenase-like protein
LNIHHKEVIIVGAGLAGLACARRLMKDDISFLILEADQRIGGRLKTDRRDGFILNHGFQVLQTGYPEARRVLDYDRLALRPFALGAIIRIDRNFHRIADPWRHPRDLWPALTAPIGTMADRLRVIRLVLGVRRGTHARIFQDQDMPTIEFLRSEGFLETMKIFQNLFCGRMSPRAASDSCSGVFIHWR